MAKYIIVVGGVISGTGKGIAAASIGLLLTLRGHKVQPLKCDGYLNSNAGVLAPREHGEVFLCDDGKETDLDLGHYQRIMGTTVSGKNIVTSGTIYREIFQEDDEGKYLGRSLQIIPHITDKIEEKFTNLGKETEVVICEIGGVVGDLESGPFLQAVRQFKQKNWDDVLIVMVAPILWVPTIKEFKTKPLQQSMEVLQSYGIRCDMLLCRVDREISPKILDKVANLTNVPREAVFEAPDVSTIYQVPIEFYNRHIDDLVADKLRLGRKPCRIHKYRDLVEKYINADLPTIKVAIVGKYDNCDEAYLSLKEAIYHAAVANNVRAEIIWVSAEGLEGNERKKNIKQLEEVDGVIVPGGFDGRGVEGKIRAIKYVREKQIPFLGICLGLQCAAIEYARNVLGFDNANSSEFDEKTPHPIVHYVEGQEGLRKKSGTMRLGAYDCSIRSGSIAEELYGKDLISERHRHRYEINPVYSVQLEDHGFKVTGTNPDTFLVEIMELDRKIHPFFIGSQAHPEFKSILGNPSPLFYGLIKAALEKKGK